MIGKGGAGLYSCVTERNRVCNRGKEGGSLTGEEKECPQGRENNINQSRKVS